MIERRILRNVRVWDDKLREPVLIDVDVAIDIDAIGHELARKGYNNRSRRSTMMAGLIDVRMRGTKVVQFKEEVPA